jgi:hypothetical protein
MALPNEDQFSEEKFMVGDNSEKMYNPEPKLGEAFETMDPENYQVEDNRNERLAVKAVELAKENEQLKADNAKYKIDLKGKALPKIDEKPLVNIDTSSLSSFATSVGDSFMNLAEVVPNKIEEIASDPVKKKNFMRGLEIINASSGIKPIGQAKSPFGAVAEGLLKAEKGFIETDIAMKKAEKQEPRRYPSTGETLLTDTFKEYQKDMKIKKDGFKSVFDRYNLGKTAALKKNELPTGVLNATFRDLKGILLELGLDGRYDALAKKFESDDYTTMTLQDQTEFNDLFQAATFEGVVQDVKKLYPVSNKDIDTLLKTKGDISTRPEALRKLMAAQMATRDIVLGSEDFAYKYFDLEDKQFEKKSIQMSEKMIADKLRKENKVTDTTLEKLFGTTKDITDAGYITASYYQQLLAQKDERAGDPFTIFVTAEKEKEAEKEKIKKKYQ